MLRSNNPHDEYLRKMYQSPRYKEFQRQSEEVKREFAEERGETCVPAVEPDPTAKFPKTRRKRYDWALGADLLASGMSAGDVARQLGCARRSVFRALKYSPALRRYIEEKRAQRRAETAAYVEGLRQEVAEKLAKLAMNGNVTALNILARQLNLKAGDYASWNLLPKTGDNKGR